jgi:hypothetical protein
MKKTLVIAAMIASSVACANRYENKIVESDYNFQLSPGAVGGIERSEYKMWEMSAKEKSEALQAYKRAVSPIVPIAYGQTTQTTVYHAGKMTGTHQVCFNNPWPLAATASYVFTINDSHHSAKLTQTLSVAGNHTLCVSHQTYLVFTPMAPGRYAFRVTTYGQMSAVMGTLQGNAFGNGFLVAS